MGDINDEVMGILARKSVEELEKLISEFIKYWESEESLKFIKDYAPVSAALICKSKLNWGKEEIRSTANLYLAFGYWLRKREEK